MPDSTAPKPSGARVVIIGEEIQEHLVDVLQLVTAGLHRGLGPCERGHVATDPQPARVGMAHRVLDPLRLEGVVEIDLPEAALGMPVHPVVRLVQRIGQRAAAGRVRAGALEEAGTAEVAGCQVLAGLALLISCRNCSLSLPTSRPIVSAATTCSGGLGRPGNVVLPRVV